jgi:4-amino-4-deoxy-L-arabinose transferase-like glycosyltransferase
MDDAVSAAVAPPAWLPGRRVLLALVVALALLVRLAHVAEIRGEPLATTLVEDELAYHEQARAIAAGDWLGDRVFYQSPLYPYFLAVVYRVAGPDPMAARIVQALLGALSCLLLALAAERLFGTLAGALAGLLGAFYGVFVFYDALILKASLVVLFSTLLLLALATRRRDGPPRSWLAPGVALGLLVLVRGNAYGYLPFLAGWIWFAHRPRFVAKTLFVAAGVALVLAPVAARNWAVGGDLVLSESQAGTNFYIGNNPGANGTYVSLRPGRHTPPQEQQDARELAEAAAGRALKPSEVSRFWFGRAFAFIAEQPGAALRLTLRKLVLFFQGYEIPDTQDFYDARDRAPGLKLAAVSFALALALAAVGVWLGRGEPRERLLPVVLVVASAATVVPFYVFSRYRLPAVPPLLALAGAALPRIAALLRSRDARRIAPAAALGAATLVLAGLPAHTGSRALAIYNGAVALESRGDRDGALRALGDAIAADPGFAESYLLRGEILLARGRVAEADADFSRHVQLTPGEARGLGRRAETAAALGRTAQSLADFGRAIAIEPANPLWRIGRGIVHARGGNLPAAAADFAAALRLDPGNAAARENLDRTRRLASADPAARAAVDAAAGAPPSPR